jgi:hypothetical protein
MYVDKPVFVSLIKSPEDNARSRVLAEAIRSFAGEMSNSPVWLFTPRGEDAPVDDLDNLDVKVITLDSSAPVPRYLFGAQVYACARAEEMARDGFFSLVWIDTSCLIIKPPVLLGLGEDADAAVRPVHIRNVGSPASEKPDGYWKKIYRTVGAEDVTSTVTSFVDGQRIRSYFNTHSFAVNPDKGLMKRWLELFKGLIEDEDFQQAYCQDDLHRIFLFQALLSALLATQINPERLRILPPHYNYPYNLQKKVPKDRRARTLNELTTFTYEGRSIDPADVTDVEIAEPLRSWLAQRVKDR